jgi:DNA polymerase-3 subunit gamma/tau
MAGDIPSTSPNPGPAELAPAPVPAASLALYRRYRPASFAEVKGQDHVTEPLRQALRSGRVHHAYLFSGPRGCGKTSSARILARSLNCELGPTPDPCGICASCIALAPTGPGSIDVIEIDAASHGGVDDARDLRERAFYAPVSGRFKIYIIDEAHMVTREGFNALLKLVEEPPPHLKFVFATTEPEKVIATIRSRTHHYPFRLVPPAVLRELLEEILGSEGVRYEPAVLPVVIRAGAGSARDSLSVLDQLIAGSDESGLSYERAVALLGYTDEALLDEVAQAFAEGDGAAVFHSINRVVEGGHDPRRFAADLLDRFRDLIVLAVVPDAAASGLLDVPADRLDRMREQAAAFGQAQLTSAAETMSAALVEMRGATSPRLLLELMCAQVLLPAPDAEGQGLLARIERLERRLESGTGPSGAVHAAAERAPGARATAAQGDDANRRQSLPPGEAGPPADAADDSAPPGSSAGGSKPGRAQVAEAGDDEQRIGRGTRGRGGEGGPATSSRTARGDAPDTDSLRERWPDVLDAVRSERKVAWLLLSNAAVDSLTDGVLTLRFGREGEARGFSGSGYDRELGQVLKAMFGIAPQIRAIAGTAQGEPGPAYSGEGYAGPGNSGPDQGGPDPEGPDPGSPDPEGQGSQDRRGRDHGGQGRGGQGQGGQGQGGGRDQDGRGQGAQRSAHPGQGGRGQGQARTGRNSTSRSADAQGPSAQGTSGRAAAGPGPVAQAGAAAEDHAAGAGRRREAGGESAHQAAGRAGDGAQSRAGIVMAQGSQRQESGPDMADPTDADALTGLDLIQRELGGQIIEEIGEQ